MSSEKDKYIGYVEMSLGVGDMIGPAIGGFIFDLSGFVGTFILFGAMIFVGIVFCIIMIPKSLNNSVNESRLNLIEEESSSIEESRDNNNKSLISSDSL